jgi:hypothetical protein
VPNPLRLAIESAIASNDIIGRSFERVGNNNFPGGFVTTAYQDANEQIAVILGASDAPLKDVVSVLRGLRSRVGSDVRAEMLDMIAFGEEEANRQLRFFKEPAGSADIMGLSEEVNAAVSAIEQKIYSQEALIQAMILTGSEKESITGREERVGVLRASDVTAMAAAFIASFVWDGFLSVVDFYSSNYGRVNFEKQAVAALDERTTQTCLQVHGQIQPFSKLFHLTGEPRYADEMDFPAFHGWCRTSVALYNSRWEDGITREMLNGAQKILSERAAGKSGYRHPANAFA